MRRTAPSRMNFGQQGGSGVGGGILRERKRDCVPAPVNLVQQVLRASGFLRQPVVILLEPPAEQPLFEEIDQHLVRFGGPCMPRRCRDGHLRGSSARRVIRHPRCGGDPCTRVYDSWYNQNTTTMQCGRERHETTHINHGHARVRRRRRRRR